MPGAHFLEEEIMTRESTTVFRLLTPLLVLLITLGCEKRPRESRPTLNDSKERFAYSAGVLTGRDLQQQGLDVNIEALVQGVKDGLEGREPQLSAEELEKLRREFREERRLAQAKKGEANLAAGEAFLRENAKKKGVVALPSGLQYRELKAGNGSSPGPADNVMAHYIVRTIDGRVLESTYEKGQPAVFPIAGVMPAWTEALPLMKKGAKWELYVPAKLAYGEKGVGNVVGPNQALIFEIEFISIH